MAAQALHPFVFKLGRIGDMVMLSAALRLLEERYGGPCCVVGADGWAPDVYRGMAEVAQCWAVPRKAPFVLGTAWPAIVRGLRDSAPGPVYVFEHHPGQVRRIRRLLRLASVDPRRCLFIAEKPGMESPWIDTLLRFAGQTPPAFSAADYPPPAPQGAWAPRLRVLDAERAERDRWLRSQGFRGEPLILVQPGNHRTMGRRRLRNWRGRDDKAWPVERWAQLLQQLQARMPESFLVLRGAAAERPLLEGIRAAAALPRLALAITGLRPLFALCECAHSVISVDSGPAHAAAALGAPLVVLYGAQPPGVWLPRSPTGSRVMPVGGPPRLERAGQITVEAVLESWLAATRADAGGSAHATAEVGAALSCAPPSSQTTRVTMEPSAPSSSVR